MSFELVVTSKEPQGCSITVDEMKLAMTSHTDIQGKLSRSLLTDRMSKN